MITITLQLQRRHKPSRLFNIGEYNWQGKISVIFPILLLLENYKQFQVSLKVEIFVLSQLRQVGRGKLVWKSGLSIFWTGDNPKSKRYNVWFLAVLCYHCKCLLHLNAADSLKSNRIKTGAANQRHSNRYYHIIVHTYSSCLQCIDYGLYYLDV